MRQPTMPNNKPKILVMGATGQVELFVDGGAAQVFTVRTKTWKELPRKAV
jgi:hypothetical protein